MSTRPIKLDRQEFGRRLKEIRAQEGYTQQELARESGLTNMAISHFECGRRMPSLENLQAILRVLGDYTEYLLDL